MKYEYVGVRDNTGRLHVFIEEDGKRKPLPHLRYHSPTGFECGYGGSGPSDLALAILLDHFNERDGIPPEMFKRYVGATEAWVTAERCAPRSFRLHQPFKQAVIAKLSRDVPIGKPYADPVITEVLPAVEVWRLTREAIHEALRSLDPYITGFPS